MEEAMQNGPANLVRVLTEKGLRIAVAEVGTGGVFAGALSAIPGAIGVFRCGVVIFDADGMRRVAGVKRAVCRQYGPNSREAAIAMAYRIRLKDKAAIGVGISGSDGGNAPIYSAICLKTGSKLWMAVCSAEPIADEPLDAFRQRVVEKTIQLLDGYFGGDAKFFAAFHSIKPYRKLCSTPLPAKILQYFLPWPGDNAGDILIKILLIATLALGIWAVGQLSTGAVTDYQTTQVIERAVKTFRQEPTPAEVSDLPAGYLDKFATAYAVNPELVGWLNIPNTNMNLPVVQHADNDYYLKHSFENQPDKNGVPFLDFRNGVQTLDNNTLIYGHNMESGAMLHSLLLYKDLEFYQQNPVITFDTVYEESQWKVVSCFEATTDANIGEVFNYFNFVRTANPERIQWYMDEITARSFFRTTVAMDISDKFLTIQTCANDRFNTKVCIVARKVRPGESADVDVENASENPDRVLPSRY